MTIEQQIRDSYGLELVALEKLNVLTNDVFAITTPSGKFALKLYNTNSRNITEVEWEIALTLHLIEHNVPVAKPVAGKDGHVTTFRFDDEDRAAVLYEWVPGEKPKAESETYALLGQTAAKIHTAADSFNMSTSREKYDAHELIDDQLQRMQKHLIVADRWQQTVDLGERLKQLIANPLLDYGICHMDLTLDNVHRDCDSMIAFDFDSSGKCWRAYEPYGVLRFSREYFNDWLDGYRSIRPFDEANEKAVEAFAIIGDIRNTTWKLGEAKSSRGKPLMTAIDLPEVVDAWLEWERG